MKFGIRKFRPSDTEHLIRIWKANGFYYAPWDSRKHLLRKSRIQPDLFLVITYKERVIGGVIGTYDGWAAYVNHLAVEPKYWLTDAPVLLLERIENKFRKFGVKTSFVFALPNHLENKFYMKHKYKKWGISICYEKRL